MKVVAEGANGPTTPDGDRVLRDAEDRRHPRHHLQRRRRHRELLRVAAEPAHGALDRGRGQRRGSSAPSRRTTRIIRDIAQRQPRRRPRSTTPAASASGKTGRHAHRRHGARAASASRPTTCSRGSRSRPAAGGRAPALRVVAAHRREERVAAALPAAAPARGSVLRYAQSPATPSAAQAPGSEPGRLEPQWPAAPEARRAPSRAGEDGHSGEAREPRRGAALRWMANGCRPGVEDRDQVARARRAMGPSPACRASAAGDRPAGRTPPDGERQPRPRRGTRRARRRTARRSWRARTSARSTGARKNVRAPPRSQPKAFSQKTCRTRCV